MGQKELFRARYGGGSDRSNTEETKLVDAKGELKIGNVKKDSSWVVEL